LTVEVGNPHFDPLHPELLALRKRVACRHYPYAHATYSEAIDVKHPVTSFVFALVSVILTPILLFIEFTALLFADMVTYEPANPLWVKIISIVVVILLGLLALAVPVLAVIMGRKSRASAKSIPTNGAGLATAAVVIAGIVTAVVVVVQVYAILTAFG
jgi:hypothetical protein